MCLAALCSFTGWRAAAGSNMLVSMSSRDDASAGRDVTDSSSLGRTPRRTQASDQPAPSDSGASSQAGQTAAVRAISRAMAPRWASRSADSVIPSSAPLAAAALLGTWRQGEKNQQRRGTDTSTGSQQPPPDCDTLLRVRGIRRKRYSGHSTAQLVLVGRGG
ncbi:hypothetical protein M011DRAFT_184026 [Sporormia fimetaria CBS 119925]|uniref:Secreted protein n=1 Tax=Sporormia fimetaria CBS 119925 TaxID=1340428 RepID=A0A6A6VNS5_9PLEO|nr:hypothetical protein M011DRAFT_184026 [Sporormia fimetaria CBS 119925]